MTAAAAPPDTLRAVVDGNEVTARVAHLLSEVVPIYPITPASPMAEHCDDWSSRGRPNLWGTVPEVISLQSEAGAAGTLHGAVTRGALGTTFTASQGLLLMLPNMYKIAGELTPSVIHVAARSIATHALSIFGDHSDVMSARTTGWALLASSGVQEAADFAAVAHAATLESRVPFLHFFDGFRTSHEMNTVDLLSDSQLRTLVDDERLSDHRLRGMDPDRPVLRGSAQNPDVFFQAREAASPFYAAVPGIVEHTFDVLAELTGRRYGLVDYQGAPDATEVMVLMGSGAGAATEAVRAMVADGRRVGLLTVRLYRPFPSQALLAALPSTVRTVTVLDRVKEPGAPGEPLYLDVVAALAEAGSTARTVGGRYGLSSKEFTPAMAKAVLDDAGAEQPRNHFTVGIVDDVSHSSIEFDPGFSTDHARVRAVFYGLGSDGTVGASKNTAKIIGEATGLHAQAYFVYDSKKSGSITVSHLRFDENPVDSSYLVEDATFVGVHQWVLLDRQDVLKVAAEGATVLLNTPYGPDEVWDRLPVEAQEQVLAKRLRLHCVNASAVARRVGMAGRINTVMQTCFFDLAGVLPRDEALERLKDAVRTTYGKRGNVVVQRNIDAIEAASAALHEVVVPAEATSTVHRRPPVPVDAPDFVQRVTARMIAGEGDLLPVSALPVDGTFPTGTAQYEKRTIAEEIPVWDADLCIDCGKCTIVCPHAAIRMKVYDPTELAGGPDDFKTKGFKNRAVPGLQLSIQVAPDDCTGCGVCVSVCPAFDKSEVKRKSINMKPIADHLEDERRWFDNFLEIKAADPSSWAPENVKNSQLREPLFEYSGACSGCGETPYIKLLTQLFGDRLLVANATGCSSIYGGNLPTTPFTVNAEGRGPAWSNSLFEDNAEFGLGMRLGYEGQQRTAVATLAALRSEVGEDLTTEILQNLEAGDDLGIAAQRERVAELTERLAAIDSVDARRLLDLTTALVRRSVWIIGGDGWAYDIGSGGLDHVLGSGRNVNVLVLDTEVYSNTGGQQSKATPRAAVAKFAASGKGVVKKDLGMEAMAFGDVYIAQIALGANEVQTVRALNEAEAWPGPSLVIAYSTCIAHGIEMAESMGQQKLAVTSGHWPLFRYRPGAGEETHPFSLDSKTPSVPYEDFMRSEARFAMLFRSNPRRARDLAERAQHDVDARWHYYEQLAGVERSAPAPDPGHAGDGSPEEEQS